VEEMLMTVLFRNKWVILSAYSLFSVSSVGEGLASHLFGYPEDQKSKEVAKQRQGTPYSTGTRPRIRITTPIKVSRVNTNQTQEDGGQSAQKPRTLDFSSDTLATLQKKPVIDPNFDSTLTQKIINASDFHSVDVDQEYSLSPIRSPRSAPEQLSPIPHYTGLIAERIELDEEGEFLEVNSNEQESFDRKHYTKEMLDAFYQGLQVGVATVFIPTSLEFALMDDGYVYELVKSRLIALFKQSDPEFNWENLLTE
jgi:hypothetical protein